MSEQYSDELYKKLRGAIETHIEREKSVLRDLELWVEFSVIYRGFVECEFMEWLNYYTDSETNALIEEKLARIPFEKVYRHKNPEYINASDEDILQNVFGKGEHEWRTNPSTVRERSIQDKLRVIKRFEYMCYYVINANDELLFDIQDYIKMNIQSDI